jgi:hypothetical protein
MNSKEQLIQQRLQTSIQKCNLHLQRLHYASNQLAGFFPLTVDRYTALSEGTIGSIDQMVFHTKMFYLFKDVWNSHVNYSHTLECK